MRRQMSGDQHYNLSRSVQAGRRFAAHLANARNRLRPLATQSGIMRAETVTRRRRIEIKMQLTDQHEMTLV